MMMLRTGSRNGGGFSSPDVYERPSAFLASNTHPRASRNIKEKQAPGCFTSRLLKNAGFSAARFFGRVGANMVKAIHFISGREFEPSSGKASPSAVPQGLAPPRDSHHSEAIEDCIKFINSTSRRSL